MPFKSYAQESFLKHRHPDIYKKWKKEHGTKAPVKRVVKK